MKLMEIPPLSDPVREEVITEMLRADFKQELNWLEFAFPKVYKLSRKDQQGRTIYFPAVYRTKVGNNTIDDMSVEPNDTARAFSFFIVGSYTQNAEYLINLPLSVVFFCNLNKISTIEPGKFTPRLIEETLNVLLKPRVFMCSNIQVTDDDFMKIYKEYTLKDIQNQYLRNPYAGFRIDFTASIPVECWQGYKTFTVKNC